MATDGILRTFASCAVLTLPYMHMVDQRYHSLFIDEQVGSHKVTAVLRGTLGLCLALNGWTANADKFGRRFNCLLLTTTTASSVPTTTTRVLARRFIRRLPLTWTPAHTNCSKRSFSRRSMHTALHVPQPRPPSRSQTSSPSISSCWPQHAPNTPNTPEG